MAALDSTQLAVTTARVGVARLGVTRLGFAPRNTTARSPIDGQLDSAGVKRFYTQGRQYKPTGGNTKVLS
jgi:hypothetical protein